MSENVNISLAVALTIRDLADQILYEKRVINDKLVVTERALPFRLKYRLGKNLISIDRDCQLFDDQRIALMAKYGTQAGDKFEIVGENNMKNYQRDLKTLLNYSTPHSIVRLEPEDIELLKDNTSVSLEDMKIFIAYMMNEPDVFKDLEVSLKVDYDKGEETPKKKITKKKTTKKDTNKKGEESLNGRAN